MLHEVHVRLHPHLGVDVVALELAHERVERDAGVLAFARELLDAVHERVLVRPVERIAGLEGQHGLDKRRPAQELAGGPNITVPGPESAATAS